MSIELFYQVEECTDNCWKAIPGRIYICPIGSFRPMLELLTLTMNQRIRRVKGKKNSLKNENWKPIFIYSPMRNRLRRLADL